MLQRQARFEVGEIGLVALCRILVKLPVPPSIDPDFSAPHCFCHQVQPAAGDALEQEFAPVIQIAGFGESPQLGKALVDVPGHNLERSSVFIPDRDLIDIDRWPHMRVDRQSFCIAVAIRQIELEVNGGAYQHSLQAPVGCEALRLRHTHKAVDHFLENRDCLVILLRGQRLALHQQVFPTAFDRRQGCGRLCRLIHGAFCRSISRFTVLRSVSARSSGRL